MKAAVLSLMVFIASTTMAQQVVQVNDTDGSLKSEYRTENDRVAVTHYFANGAVKETGYFENGVPVGRWVTYNPDGVKTAELNYRDGKRHGEFRVWDEFANAYMEIQYANGQIVTANRYVKETQLAAKDR